MIVLLIVVLVDIIHTEKYAWQAGFQPTTSLAQHFVAEVMVRLSQSNVGHPNLRTFGSLKMKWPQSLDPSDAASMLYCSHKNHTLS